MPQKLSVPHILSLPELKIMDWKRDRFGRQHVRAIKLSKFEVCPKCATPAHAVYDHRWIHVHDQPLRDKDVWLHILKRRFYCKSCRKPFTEPVPGIRKGKRTTERYAEVLFGPVKT